MIVKKIKPLEEIKIASMEPIIHHLGVTKAIPIVRPH